MLNSHPSLNLLVVDERANPEIWDTLLGVGWYAEKKEYLIGKAIDIRGLRGSRLLKAVISHGAKISTPMLGAVARFGDGESFKILLEHFTPEQMNKHNALGMAAISYFDPIDKMNMLLEKGVDINFVTGAKNLDPDFLQGEREYYTWGRFKGSALHLAAEWGLEDVVKWLLARGARADIKDSGGNYAMQRAEEAEHFEVRDLILAVEHN
jgi:hypothetical protein